MQILFLLWWNSAACICNKINSTLLKIKSKPCTLAWEASHGLEAAHLSELSSTFPSPSMLRALTPVPWLWHARLPCDPHPTSPHPPPLLSQDAAYSILPRPPLAPSCHSGLGSEVFSTKFKWTTTSPPPCSLHVRHCVVSFSTMLLTLKLSGSLSSPTSICVARAESLYISLTTISSAHRNSAWHTVWIRYKSITHRPWEKLPQNISSRIESTVEWRGPQKTQIFELVNDFLLHKVFCNPFSLSPPSLSLIPSLLSSPLLPFSYFLSLSPYLSVTYTNTHTQSQTGSHKPWVASEEHTEAGRKGKPGKASRKLQ